MLHGDVRDPRWLRVFNVGDGAANWSRHAVPRSHARKPFQPDPYPNTLSLPLARNSSPFREFFNFRRLAGGGEEALRWLPALRTAPVQGASAADRGMQCAGGCAGRRCHKAPRWAGGTDRLARPAAWPWFEPGDRSCNGGALAAFLRHCWGPSDEITLGFPRPITVRGGGSATLLRSATGDGSSAEQLTRGW